MVVEAPGQLPSLPSPKSGPVVSGDIRLFVKNARPTIYKNIYIRCTIIYKKYLRKVNIQCKVQRYTMSDGLIVQR